MAKYLRNDESVLQSAISKIKSLRTTVPTYLVNQVDLRKGDKLKWGIEIGSVIIQVVRPEIAYYQV